MKKKDNNNANEGTASATAAAAAGRAAAAAVASRAAATAAAADGGGAAAAAPCSVHAEVMTYYRVPKRLRRRPIVLLVVRISRDRRMPDRLRLSKPCAACQEFIAARRLRVIYSTDEPATPAAEAAAAEAAAAATSAAVDADGDSLPVSAACVSQLDSTKNSGAEQPSAASKPSPRGRRWRVAHHGR